MARREYLPPHLEEEIRHLREWGGEVEADPYAMPATAAVSRNRVTYGQDEKCLASSQEAQENQW